MNEKDVFNLAELPQTQYNIMIYLEKELANGSKYIDYDKIGRSITPQRSRHAVAHAIDKLRLRRLIFIRDGRLSLI